MVVQGDGERVYPDELLLHPLRDVENVDNICTSCGFIKKITDVENLDPIYIP